MNRLGNNTKAISTLYVAAAYIVWGFLPLYWKKLNGIPSEEILGHRVLWSFAFILLLAVNGRRLKKVYSILKDKRSVFIVFSASVLISINWGTYIWAVNSNRMVEASMGYYINPLMVVLLGMLILKEKLTALQYAALGFAAAGVCYIAISFGKVPYVALILASSFAVYGLMKKQLSADALEGMLLETAFIAPIAFIYIMFKEISGAGALLNSGALTVIMLLLSGAATATPLLWFARGAKGVELSTIGFLQYIAPSISLVLGILVFNESFTNAHKISFGMIWLGLLLFALSKTLFSSNIKAGNAKTASDCD
ncbi:MAG: EamA family transporter RarD [Bacillota bacterium]